MCESVEETNIEEKKHLMPATIKVLLVVYCVSFILGVALAFASATPNSQYFYGAIQISKTIGIISAFVTGILISTIFLRKRIGWLIQFAGAIFYVCDIYIVYARYNQIRTIDIFLAGFIVCVIFSKSGRLYFKSGEPTSKRIKIFLGTIWVTMTGLALLIYFALPAYYENEVVKALEKYNTYFVVEPEYALLGDSRNGWMRGLDIHGNQWLINQEGARFPFDEKNEELKLYPSLERFEEDGLVGLKTAKGEITISAQYAEIYLENSSEGMISARKADSPNLLLLTIDGELIADLGTRYDKIRKFRDGIAIAEKDGWCGYIDVLGNEIYPIAIDSGWVRDFSDGYASVYRDGDWGVIDKEGKVVIDNKYFVLGDYSEGLLEATFLGGSTLRGFIDLQENTILEDKYVTAEAFSDGIAKVEIAENYSNHKEKGYSFIDHEGNEILFLSESYFGVEKACEGLIVVRTIHGNRYGAIKNPLYE